MKAKAKRAYLDIISNLPSPIIQNILCLLPIKEAARTSILSKKWRYTWVIIPKLVFNEKDMFDKTTDGQLSLLEETFENPPSERKQLTRKCKVFYAIHQVLLLHQGPIHEFSLSMEADDTCVEIDQIILHLARYNNPIKKLTLRLSNLEPCSSYNLPLSIFSLHQLTDLHYSNYTFNFDPTFSGFGSLTSLYFMSIDASTEAALDYDGIDELITFSELFECLPVIEDLTIHNSGIELKCSAQDSVSRELPTAVVNLKYFCIKDVMLFDEVDLPFVCHVTKSYPSLEKIKLDIFNFSYVPPHIKLNLDSLEDCSDIWLENLKEFEISGFDNLEGESGFVKLILARSPMLKKAIIAVSAYVNKDREMEI
ncbi:F-box/FBD/LRR-repeat protein-like protein [Tanacetum coccineum]